jgi:lipoyl(octanoyl) transferase
LPDWRLILGAGDGAALRPAPGSRNMAVDHALLDSVKSGGRPVLRFYLWAPACLSFGRNQHARGLYDAARLAAAGVDVVRRPTGGLAVLHDQELTYCVAAPARLLGGPREAYRAINRALVAGLQRLGVPVSVAAAGAAPDPRRDAAAPCFRAPAAGEVVAAGRKLVGSAQRCEQHTLLQHGSILLDGSQEAVAGLLQHAAAPSGSAAPGSITLRELVGAAPDPGTLVGAIVEGFSVVLGTCLAQEPLDPEERVRADRLAAVYAGADWTWRR